MQTNCIVKKSSIFYVFSFKCGQIAQLVEQRTENPCVAGSIPVLATSVEALYVLLLFSLAGENGIPTELVISLNHPKQIFKNVLEDCFGVSVPLNLR